MMFESASAWIVKSIKQRDLLNTWLRSYAGRNGIPKLSEYEPSRFQEEMPELAFLTVTSTAPVRLVIDSAGARISLAFGGIADGKLVNEYVNPKLLPVTMPLYDECIKRGLPIYTVSSVTDIQGTTVAHERLILPFAESDRIDRMIVSMKPISEEGNFEIKGLMVGESHLPVFEICAVIDQNLYHAVPAKNSWKDDIE
jgi:hypothetical protein